MCFGDSKAVRHLKNQYNWTMSESDITDFDLSAGTYHHYAIVQAQVFETLMDWVQPEDGLFFMIWDVDRGLILDGWRSDLQMLRWWGSTRHRQ